MASTLGVYVMDGPPFFSLSSKLEKGFKGRIFSPPSLCCCRSSVDVGVLRPANPSPFSSSPLRDAKVRRSAAPSPPHRETEAENGGHPPHGSNLFPLFFFLQGVMKGAGAILSRSKVVLIPG